MNKIAVQKKVIGKPKAAQHAENVLSFDLNKLRFVADLLQLSGSLFQIHFALNLGTYFFFFFFSFWFRSRTNDWMHGSQDDVA